MIASASKGDMAPVLFVLTTGNNHDGNTSEGRSRGLEFSDFLLFDHNRDELDIGAGHDVADVLKNAERIFVCPLLRASAPEIVSNSSLTCVSLPRNTIAAPHLE
jgi:hypothetical protein